MHYPNNYEKTFSIDPNQLTSNHELSLVAMFEMFQDVAGEHASYIGASFEDMLALGYHWVIVRYQINILKHPKNNETLKIKTWPIPPTRFYFDRLYEMRDANDQVCALGRSRYLLIDMNQRKMQASSVYQYPLTEFYPQQNYQSEFPSLTHVKPNGKAVLSHIVEAKEVDQNEHFNNTRYAQLVADVLKSDADNPIGEIFIYYHNECYLGDQIEVYMEKTDDVYLLSGYVGDKLTFTSQVSKRK